MKCRWFALCENEAEGYVAHPVFKAVPTCPRCASKMGLKFSWRRCIVCGGDTAPGELWSYPVCDDQCFEIYAMVLDNEITQEQADKVEAQFAIHTREDYG